MSVTDCSGAIAGNAFGVDREALAKGTEIYSLLLGRDCIDYCCCWLCCTTCGETM